MNYAVYNSENQQVGEVYKDTDGWYFVPFTDAHKRSRKGWPTPERSIPKWVGNYELQEITDENKGRRNRL